MKRLARTLVLDDSRYVTGALKSLLAMLRYHPETGRLILAVQPEVASHAILKTVPGFRIHPTRFFPPSLRGAGLLNYLHGLMSNTVQLYVLCRREKIEAVHVNDCHNLCGCLLKCLMPSLKLIYHVRLLPTSYLARIYPILIGLIKLFADQIFCNSQAVFEAVGNSSKKQLLYNGIRLPQNPTEFQEKDGTSICYLGNFLPGKGQDLALRCLACIHQQLPEATLHFYGGWEMSPKSREFKLVCQDLVEELSLQGKVFFHGFAENIEGPLCSCTLLLNLSESESFSRVCLEAVAQGLPVVAANSGGPAEILKDGAGGVLVPNRDWRQAASACLDLLRDPKLRLSLVNAGYERARKLFDEESQARILLESYSINHE